MIKVCDKSEAAITSYRAKLTCSEVKRTSLGAAAMPLVLTSGKNLYLAIITLYMLEIAPPAEQCGTVKNCTYLEFFTITN